MSWDERIGDISGTHTQVAGMLAGFSATILVLLIGPGAANLTPALRASAGLFAMAFFGYVAAGILFAITVERDGKHQALLFSLASSIYYFPGVLSFIAIYPLAAKAELRGPIGVMIIGAVIGGYSSASVPLVDLLGIKKRVLAIVFLVATLMGLGLQKTVLGHSSDNLGYLLYACALVQALGFNFAVATFFFPSWNTRAVRARATVLLIGLAALVLAAAATMVCEL